MIADSGNAEHKNELTNIAGRTDTIGNESRADHDSVEHVDPIDTLLAHLEHVIQRNGDTDARDIVGGRNISCANHQKEGTQNENMCQMDDLMAVHLSWGVGIKRAVPGIYRMSNNSDNEREDIFVSEDYYTYLSTLIVDERSDLIRGTFHVNENGEIIINVTGNRIIPSADSTFALGASSVRWRLIERLVAGGLDIGETVRLAIRMYDVIPEEVVLTDQAVSLLCAHYANNGNRRLVFEVNCHGDLTIRPPAQR